MPTYTGTVGTTNPTTITVPAGTYNLSDVVPPGYSPAPAQNSLVVANNQQLAVTMTVTATDLVVAVSRMEVLGVYGYPGVQPLVRFAPELAFQTFGQGTFLKNASGYLASIASNDLGVVGVSTNAGQNLPVATCEFIVATPALLLEMNLLTAGATHALAVTDLWTPIQYTLTSNCIVGDTTTTTPRILPVQLPLDLPGQKRRGVIGDTNARVYAVLLGTACYG